MPVEYCYRVRAVIRTEGEVRIGGSRFGVRNDFDAALEEAARLEAKPAVCVSWVEYQHERPKSPGKFTFWRPVKYDEEGFPLPLEFIKVGL